MKVYVISITFYEESLIDKPSMNLNFSHICRLCLRFCDSEFVDLNQNEGTAALIANDIIQKIKFCYFIKVNLSEGLPSKVCYECIQVLSYFDLAKKNVLISDQLLRNVVIVREILHPKGRLLQEENTSEIEANEINEMPEANLLYSETQQEISEQNSLEAVTFNTNTSVMTVRTPAVDVDRYSEVCDTDKNTVILKDKNKLTVKQKNFKSHQNESKDGSAVGGLLSHSKENSDDLISLKHLQEILRNYKNRNSNNLKDKDENIQGTDLSSRGKIKKTGPVVDFNNTLSPCAQRKKKCKLPGTGNRRSRFHYKTK